MKLSDLPTPFNIPFASAAGGGYVRTVPEASQVGVQNGAASLTTGFPPLNWLPVGAGGVPPFGQDMNGILRQVTQWNRWQAAGSLSPYNSSFSTAIGGYPLGAVLSSATPGSVWLNAVDDNTTNPDAGGADWFLIANATSIQSSEYVYAVAGGTANAITATFSPAIASNAAGTKVRVKISAMNTGAVTFNAGPGVLPVTNNVGGDLQTGDLPLNTIIELICTGSAWYVNGLVFSQVVQPTASSLTFYVRTDGSDSNNGSANTAGSAFATIQGAVNYITSRYGSPVNPAIIQIGLAGTYSSPTSIPPRASIVIKGDTANPTNYTVQQGTASVDIINVSNAYCLIQGVTLRNMNTSSHWVTTTDGGLVELDTVRFTANGGVSGLSMIHPVYGGSIKIIGPLTITSGAQAIFLSSAGSVTVNTGITITLTGTPAFSQATAVSYATGAIFLSGATFSGAATGQRYLATMNGVIVTQGGGASFIPGNSAGSTASGGQYD